MPFYVNQCPTEELMRYFVGAQHGKPVGVVSAYYQGSIEQGFWSGIPYLDIITSYELSADVEYEYLFIPRAQKDRPFVSIVHTFLSSCASGAAGCCRTYLQVREFPGPATSCYAGRAGRQEGVSSSISGLL